MEDRLADVAKNIAHNILDVRKRQGLSQQQLAKMANIPRSTITYIESGDANPTLSNLVRISRALKLSLDELLSPNRPPIQYYKKEDIPVLEKTGVEVYKVLPDPIPGMEIDKIVLQAGHRKKGTPHSENTKEYFYCLKGEFVLYLQGKSYRIKKEELLAFPGHLPHAYINDSKYESIAISVVSYAHSL